jgi:hypothetical protein
MRIADFWLANLAQNAIPRYRKLNQLYMFGLLFYRAKGGLKNGIELAEHNFCDLHGSIECLKYPRSAAHPKSLHHLR